MSHWNSYQIARLLFEGLNDYYNRGSSWNNPWFNQGEDVNAFASTGRGSHNVRQGRDGHSVNAGSIANKGHNNLIQHGGLNAGYGAGKSFFNWQGAGDHAVNYSKSDAKAFHNWQRGKENVSDGSGSKTAEIWQGGYADGTTNMAIGAKRRNDFTQVTGKDGVNFADANGGKSRIEQYGEDGTINLAKGSKRNDDISQTTTNGFQGADGGAGDDKITANGDNNIGILDGGKGNDDFYLNGKGNSYEVNGGKGDNRAFFGRGADSYNIKRDDDGTWTVTDRDNPEARTTLRNIDELHFKGGDGSYERYREPAALPAPG